MTGTRRELLNKAAWVAGLSLLPAWGQTAVARVRSDAYPFALGVASGDPAPDGFVLWTRLAPQPLQDDGGMPPQAVQVNWEVAHDDQFRTIARRGQATARPESAHSVHVELEGLQPGRDYFYRFRVGAETSPVGRTRTTPPLGADVQALRYAFTACHRYENGYYAGYRQLVADDPALVLFLGDYIYEHAPRDGLPRRHNDEATTDLRTYRLRHALYKTDKDLQAAHAAAPWMVIWDDHEVINNYSGDQHEGLGSAELLRRRAAAYQAYYEHMPLRRRSIPVGPNMHIYRALDWGRLAQFQLLDCRQYRDEASLEGAPSILGEAQEKWLHDQLSSSQAQWNVLTQQFMMAEARRPDARTGEMTVSLDGWDGYGAARNSLLTYWRDSGTKNPMAIGGDSHAFIASDLAIGDGPVIASAFVGGSMSSTSGGDFDHMVKASPRVRFGENMRRGYTIVDVTPQQSLLSMRATLDATQPDTTTNTLRQFVIENGAPGFRNA